MRSAEINLGPGHVAAADLSGFASGQIIHILPNIRALGNLHSQTVRGVHVSGNSGAAASVLHFQHAPFGVVFVFIEPIIDDVACGVVGVAARRINLVPAIERQLRCRAAAVLVPAVAIAIDVPIQ
jgi:hypothetical protein